MMPLANKIPLIGEIPFQDFCVPFCHMVKLDKANQWFQPCVTGFACANADLCKNGPMCAKKMQDEQQIEMANHFNSEVKAPYYIIPGFAETKGAFQVIFFDKGEAKAFQEKFGDAYKMDEDSFEQNLKIMAERKKRIDWRPKDQRLIPYLKEAILAERESVDMKDIAPFGRAAA